MRPLKRLDSPPDLISFQNTTTGLKLVWSDNSQAIFHPIWLRENSQEIGNVDEKTKLRITQAAFLPLDLAINKVALDDNANLQITFSDEHICYYLHTELHHRLVNPRPHETGTTRHYWDSELVGFEHYQYNEICEDDAVLYAALNTVSESGFAAIHGIPLEVDAIESFTKRVGPIRETNWGTVTDVRNIPNPYDLTMTACSLSPHVDNPYRLPGPGYIFMHCLLNDADGGESTMVDGFAAALKLKEINPTAFDILTRFKPGFRHRDSTAILEDYGPLIELDEAGDIKRIRYSNRTEQVPYSDIETLNDYYRARQAFAQLIFSDQMTLKIKLMPGDGFIWDNYRILHGRTAFDVSTGDRHMRHCYMDRDIFSSRFKLLSKKVSEHDNA